MPLFVFNSPIRSRRFQTSCVLSYYASHFRQITLAFAPRVLQITACPYAILNIQKKGVSMCILRYSLSIIS